MVQANANFDQKIIITTRFFFTLLSAIVSRMYIAFHYLSSASIKIGIPLLTTFKVHVQ